MKTNHTPGPWATDEADHDCPYQDIRVKAGTRGICKLWMDDAPLHDFNAEQSANARLIAAAPELLAVALLAKEFEQHAGGTHLPASAWFELHQALNAAINKALGESV